MMRRTRSWGLGALAACCVAACSMIGHQALAQTPFDAQFAADGEALVECLEAEGRALAVLFLVDDSASLQSRDPENSRVPALQAAVTSLGLVAETRAVYLDIYRFGTDVVRAFDDVPSWSKLDAELQIQLEERIEAFADWQVARDTDYALALLRSIEVLPNAPAGACRLIVWFTDGQLDFEYDGAPKPREWTDDFVIQSSDDAREATRLAEVRICDENALIDELRGEDLTADGAFIAAVALGNPERGNEFDLLYRVVTNRDEDCGTRPAKGTVTRTFDVAGLTGLLVRAVDPAPPGATTDDLVALADNECAAPLDPSAPGAFTVPSSLESMRARLEATDPSVRAVVVAPEEIGGSRIVELGRDVELSSASGLQVRIAALSDRLSGVTLDFPAQLGAWASDWEFRFCTSDPGLVGSTGVVEVLNVTGEARAEIVEGITLRRGRSGTVSVQLIGRGGDPIGGDALGSAPPLLTVTDAELGPIELDLAGRARSSVNIPGDFANDKLIVDAALEPLVEVFPPGRPWPLSPWIGKLSLEVRDLPVYPLVELPGSFQVLDQENLVGAASMPIVADGDESAGCLTLERATFEELPDGAGRFSVRVLDGERVITPGEPCPIELEAGEERELVVEVEASREQARLAGLRSGELVMRSTSAIDPKESEVFTYPLEVRVRPLIVVEDPSVELLLIYFVLAALAPIALLYAYNILWGARLDVVSTPLVAIPVEYDGRSLHRRDQSGGSGVLTVGADDVRPWGQSSGRPRRLSGRLPDGEELRLRARASWLPWGQPYATSEIGGHRLQLGPLGRLRRTGTGHIGLSTSGLWVAGMTPTANTLGRLTTQGAQESDGPAWDGVIAVLPGMGIGSDVVSRADHIVAAAKETISLALESDEAQRTADEDAGDDAADSESSDDTPLENKRSEQDDLPGARPGRRGAKGSFDDPPSGPGRPDPGSDGLPTSDRPFGRGSPGSSSWPTSGGDGLPP